MDSIISFLGSNYTVIERWGIPLGVALAAVLVFAAWAISRRGLGWWRRAALIGLCVVAIAGLLAIRFVAKYIQPLFVPDGYAHRAVAFSGPGGTLGGELLLPQRGDPRPAVILLVGSDASSYRTNYARLANEVLTPLFAKLGCVILYFDKRGVGRSEGDWTQVDFPGRAEDGRAALRFLSGLPEVNPKQLIVVGHSQGGWITQILAADSVPPALAISLAGPAVGVEEQITDDETGSLVCRGVPEKDATAKAQRLLAELREKSRAAKSGRYRQFAVIKDHLPGQFLRAARSPLLLLFGGNDTLVPPGKNLQRLEEIYHGAPPTPVRVKVIPGVGHSFRVMERCHQGSQKALVYSPALSDEIISMVQEHIHP